MADTTTVAEDARPFSEYVREENKREREGLPASGDASVEPVPVVPSVEESAAAGEGADGSGTTETAPEPVAEVDAPASDDKSAKDEKDDDLYIRRADGTFKKRTPQDRINVAVRRQRAAEERAARIEQELAALRAAASSAPRQVAEPETTPAVPSVPAPSSAAKPVLDQFLNEPDPYAAWMEALADYKANERLTAYQQQEAERQAQSQFMDQARQVMETGMEAHEDWASVMQSEFAQHFRAPALMEAIYSLESPELSAEALYFLGTHEREARALAALPPLAAAASLGRYLASSAASNGSAANGVVTSRAKPLIRPVGASPVAHAPSPPDPEKTSFSDWVKVQNAADRKAKKEGRA